MHPARLTSLAMAVAGFMIAHHVAAKAVRDATFLSAWDPTALPAMVIATAVVVIAAVPLYSRLLARFSPRVIVPAGFLLSAAAHMVEWQLSPGSRWIAVVIYLHIAGLSALLLSGFWSMMSELFDPADAKRSFGRIAAGGTIGGLSGGVAAERIAATLPEDAALVFLAGVHLVVAAGLVVLARAGSGSARQEGALPKLFEFDALQRAPHLKTLAILIVVGTAGAGIIDYLWKSHAAAQFPSQAQLLQFFALFYTAIQIVTFLAQAAVSPVVRRLGLGQTVSSLPIGLGSTSILALVFQGFPMLAVARGVESVLRGSLFRSGYELLFVPMDPAEKRRTKTFLDVTCDRGGDALGAIVVQVLLLTGPTFLMAELLAVTIGLALVGIWLGRRLDALYVRVVERRLVGQVSVTPDVIGSEANWTVIDLPMPTAIVAHDLTPTRQPPPSDPPATPAPINPRLQALADLQSGDRASVERALRDLENPDMTHIAVIVQLLAWDDVVGSARRVLEQRAASHVGLLVDSLLDPDSDFAIRRRIPRILGTLSSQRALDGLIRGLDDPRFEVRYQCGRAIDRMLGRDPALDADPARLLVVVDRELSVPVQVWDGHRVIDKDQDESGEHRLVSAGEVRQNVEHIFSLLAGVLPREPLQVAFRGVCSDDRMLRGLAREYLDSVLPEGIRAKLWRLVAADDEAKTVRMAPEKALEALRRSQQTRVVRPDET